MRSSARQQQDWERALLDGRRCRRRGADRGHVPGLGGDLPADGGTRPDDAYLLGVCPRTGTKVAIGDQTAARARVREVHGEAVIWLTPHECASLLASQQTVASLKRLFPGAELFDLYPHEPGKGDA